jgi:hypothetical protein
MGGTGLEPVKHRRGSGKRLTQNGDQRSTFDPAKSLARGGVLKPDLAEGIGGKTGCNVLPRHLHQTTIQPSLIQHFQTVEATPDKDKRHKGQPDNDGANPQPVIRCKGRDRQSSHSQHHQEQSRLRATPPVGKNSGQIDHRSACQTLLPRDGRRAQNSRIPHLTRQWLTEI